MNWDTVAGNWKQFKGKVQMQWGKLTDDLATQSQELEAACDDEDAALYAALDAMRANLHTHTP